MIGVFLTGAAAGVISGMGIGGGAILIPALVFLQGVTQHQAQGINLIYFIPTAIIALLTHAKNHNIEVKIAKSVAIMGVLGAVAGAFLAVRMNSELLQKIFGGFLFVMGLSELFKKKV